MLDYAHERATHEFIMFCLSKDFLRLHFNKNGANYALSTTKTSKNYIKLTVTSAVLDAEKF